MAENKGLDLVEVAPNAKPPVCKIMDYGKFRYQQSKKQTHKKTIEVKEVKVRPNINEHDLELKIKNIMRFLEDGNKAKVTMFFRGREIVRPEIGKRVFDIIMERIEDKYIIESKPKLQGKSMTMVISPKKK